MTAPRYRVEREASEEQAWQQLINLLRRLVGLRIKRTGQQAYDEYLKQCDDEPATEKAGCSDGCAATLPKAQSAQGLPKKIAVTFSTEITAISESELTVIWQRESNGYLRLLGIGGQP